LQPPFLYENHSLAELTAAVSQERLQHYLGIAGGDAAQALRHYMWNTALSDALYGPLQGLEITLRNKIRDRLVLPGHGELGRASQPLR